MKERVLKAEIEEKASLKVGYILQSSFMAKRSESLSAMGSIGLPDVFHFVCAA